MIYKSFKVTTPGASLGVLFPQGRHSVTYNKHMPMKELHTAMQPDCPGKFPYRTTGSRCSPNVSANSILCELVLTHGGDSNPKSSAERPVPIRITPQWLAISGPNLCPVTEHRGWEVWLPHLLPHHSIITPIGLAVGSVSCVFAPISVNPWLLTIRQGAGTLPLTLRKA